ncbi:DUF2059 domain-containing protein [Chachezhania antarctica]|uniref:DUF2059 domain-containing protein n=1 Tax=Chachezhania antarctica TaxID=2340860 RepID=UPI001F088B63|nr:DUF2059 domain-containing protein [Chachezhania antarctica]
MTDPVRTRSVFPARLAVFMAALAIACLSAAPSRAFDSLGRDRIEQFLEITGFDVAMESVGQTAGSAPAILGMDTGSFGSEWTRLTEEVFAPEILHDLAVQILEASLTEDLADHAENFYATELGQRLVLAENAAHMSDDETDRDEGAELVAQMVREGSPRIGILKRMNSAIGSTETSLAAIREIQLRFLIAANAAGVIDLPYDYDTLSEMMKEQEGPMRVELEASALAHAALTYRDFSDEEILIYTEALEAPLMQDVYELLLAIQNEITANRFEALAARMADLSPGQDI